MFHLISMGNGNRLPSVVLRAVEYDGRLFCHLHQPNTEQQYHVCMADMVGGGMRSFWLRVQFTYWFNFCWTKPWILLYFIDMVY